MNNREKPFRLPLLAMLYDQVRQIINHTSNIRGCGTCGNGCSSQCIGCGAACGMANCVSNCHSNSGGGYAHRSKKDDDFETRQRLSVLM